MLLASGCGRVGFSALHGGTDADASADAPAVDAGFDPTAGLEYWYRLDETSGHAVADSSANAFTGYAVNLADLAWTAGHDGGGLHFDGSGYNSFVIFPATTSGSCAGPPPAISGSFTVAAWIEFDSFKDWNGYSLGDVAVMHGSNGGMDGGWGLGATNGCGTEAAGITIAPMTSSRTTRCGATMLSPNVWYHVAGVYDAAARTLDVYLDGVNDDGGLTPVSPQIPSAIVVPPASQCPYLGASANQSQLFVGTLDQVRVYTRALSAAEIAQLYALGG